MKKKLIAILLILMAVCSLCACKKDPYSGMSESEKLVSVGTWEKKYITNQTLSFSEDGAGKLVLETREYDFSWKVESGRLYIDILPEGEHFDYSMNMFDDNFTLTNTQTGTSATFVFGGSQVYSLPEMGERATDIIGEWKSDEENTYAVAFNDDGSGFRYALGDAAKTHIADFKWTYDAKTETLYLYFQAEEAVVYYNYTVESDILSLTNLSTNKTYEYTRRPAEQ